jgi:hypothetical protein
LPHRIRPEDLPRINEAFGCLFRELGKATELYQEPANAGREGVIHSVETVLKFLSRFGPVISSSLHAPLTVLFDALMSLDDGKIAPLLKPARTTGRAPASAIRQSLIGAAAFTVTRLTETGMHAPAAHKAVAKTLKSAGIKPARGRNATITARTIRGWCEEVSADFGRRGEAAQTYDLMLEGPRDHTTSDLPPEQARALLVDRLATVARRIRADEGA